MSIIFSPNPGLLKESEKAQRRNKAFLKNESLARVNRLCMQIEKLNTTDEENIEYKNLLYALIRHCQDGVTYLGVGMEEKEAIEQALLFLSNQYRVLINRITTIFIRKHPH